jgi:hypothetical protein
MLKQADNLLTMSQVTTLIQANVLIGNVSRKTMKDKPSIKKIKGGSFVAETFAIQGPTIVISNQAVACLTIQTN